MLEGASSYTRAARHGTRHGSTGTGTGTGTEVDEHVEQFRHRPLDEARPFTFVSADALTIDESARAGA